MSFEKIAATALAAMGIWSGANTTLSNTIFCNRNYDDFSQGGPSYMRDTITSKNKKSGKKYSLGEPEISGRESAGSKSGSNLKRKGVSNIRGVNNALVGSKTTTGKASNSKQTKRNNEAKSLLTEGYRNSTLKPRGNLSDSAMSSGLKKLLLEVKDFSKSFSAALRINPTLFRNRNEQVESKNERPSLVTEEDRRVEPSIVLSHDDLESACRDARAKLASSSFSCRRQSCASPSGSPKGNLSSTWLSAVEVNEWSFEENIGPRIKSKRKHFDSKSTGDLKSNSASDRTRSFMTGDDQTHTPPKKPKTDESKIFSNKPRGGSRTLRDRSKRRPADSRSPSDSKSYPDWDEMIRRPHRVRYVFHRDAPSEKLLVPQGNGISSWGSAPTVTRWPFEPRADYYRHKDSHYLRYKSFGTTSLPQKPSQPVMFSEKLDLAEIRKNLKPISKAKCGF